MALGLGLGDSVGLGGFNWRRYWAQLLAPVNNYGMYVQPGATSKYLHVFNVIDTDANCIVHDIRPGVPSLEGLGVIEAGATKGYYVTLPTSKSGTFLGGDTKSDFCSVAGGTITLNFTGTRISFYSYTDNRGGYWNFSIDGGAAIKVTRWAAAGAYTLTTIATGLTYGAHTIVGTFMGDDPDHEPSGGVGTGRGWVSLNAVSTGTEFQYKCFYVGDYQNVNYIGFSSLSSSLPMDNKMQTESIRQFAWNIKKNGGAYATNFIPDHTTTTQIAFDNLATDRTVTVDGTPVDLTSLTLTYASSCSSVVMSQSYHGFNSNDPSEILIDVLERVTFEYGGVRQNVKITALQDLFCTVAYISMLPFATAQFDNFVTSHGNEYACVKTDGSVTTLTEGTNFSLGYATNKSGSDDLKSNLFGIKIKLSPDPYNISDGLTKTVFILHTSATMQKLYLQIAALNDVIPSNSVYEFQTDYVMNRIANAYNIVSSKFNV